ncbi:MAG: hypothetical protein WD225_13180 [Ilumatobacteraceae bacterium]
MLSSIVATVLAIAWEPELRGVLVVIIAVVVLCGSLYLVLSTNMGARLGFLVALTGLTGWIVLLGSLWWIYGIGLIGPDPSWEQVPGRTVIQDASALPDVGVLEGRVGVDDDADPGERAMAVRERLVEEGWSSVDESEPGFGQAANAAGNFLQETEAFGAGEFTVTGLFDIGGDRWPKIGDSIDFLAFFHEPRYALAEVAPLEQLREEPGRAPVQPEIDPDRERQYVYMERDPGARRQPAALLTIGFGIMFLALCWMLHRRDRIVAENRAAELIPAG